SLLSLTMNKQIRRDPRRAKPGEMLEHVYHVDEKDNPIIPPFRPNQVVFLKMHIDCAKELNVANVDAAIDRLCKLSAIFAHVHRLGIVLGRRAFYVVEADR